MPALSLALRHNSTMEPKEISEYLGESTEATIEACDGELVNRMLVVESVFLDIEGYKTKIHFGEEVAWDEAKKRAVGQLAQEHIDDIQESKEIPDADGSTEFSVSKDTYRMKIMLVIGYLQPVKADIVDEVLDYEGVRSSVSNIQNEGYIQAVAKDGVERYYSLTPHGWKQVLSVFGVEGWRKEAEEILTNYVPPDDEDDKDSGLAAFDFDNI